MSNLIAEVKVGNYPEYEEFLNAIKSSILEVDHSEIYPGTLFVPVPFDDTRVCPKLIDGKVTLWVHVSYSVGWELYGRDLDISSGHVFKSVDDAVKYFIPTTDEVSDELLALLTCTPSTIVNEFFKWFIRFQCDKGYSNQDCLNWLISYPGSK